MAVFVLDKHQKPLMPCSEKRDRRRPEGWLAPSLRHRIENILTWVNRFRKRVPLSALTCEKVRFDPEIRGIEYTKGTLFGYEVREYILEKQIVSTGRGTYQRTRVDRFGFPRGYLLSQKRVHGFQTGDHVIASVPSGKKQGRYTGRVAIRASGCCTIQTSEGIIQGISSKHCHRVQRTDGYQYQKAIPAYKCQQKIVSTNQTEERRFLPALKGGVSAPSIG